MASVKQVRDFGIETTPGTGIGMQGLYNPNEYIKIGRETGVTDNYQYVKNTPANKNLLNRLRDQLAGGPLGQRGADGRWDGVWYDTDVIPEGQTVGQKATGSYANKAASQNAFADLTNAAYKAGKIEPPPPEEIIDKEITTDKDGTTTTTYDSDPGTGLSETTAIGGNLGGTTPPGTPGGLAGVGFGDGSKGTTPPPTNAQVNNALTTVTSVMQNSRNKDGAKTKTLSTAGTRPGGPAPITTTNNTLNLGGNKKGSRSKSKLGTISSVGLNF